MNDYDYTDTHPISPEPKPIIPPAQGQSAEIPETLSDTAQTILGNQPTEASDTLAKHQVTEGKKISFAAIFLKMTKLFNKIKNEGIALRHEYDHLFFDPEKQKCTQKIKKLMEKSTIMKILM